MASGSSVAGEWQQEGANGSQRRLRVSSRGDRLELEVQHSPAVLVLTSDGSPGFWNALFDPARAPWAAPGPEAKTAYQVELTSGGRLSLRRPGADGGPAAEFSRISGPPARGSDDEASRSPLVRRQRARPSSRPRVVRSRSPHQPPQHSQNARSWSPGLFSGEPGVAADDDDDDVREKLIQQVKNRQKASKDVNKRWREFCQKEGGGIFDPTRHDASFLEEFLEREGRFMNTRGPPGRSRSRGRGCSLGSNGARGRWRDGSGSRSSPRRLVRPRRRSQKLPKRRNHVHGRRREKRRRREEEAACRGRGRDRKRRKRPHKGGKGQKESASGASSGSGSSGESSAPSSELVAAKGTHPQEQPELVAARRAVESARTARSTAEASVAEVKDATTAEVDRVVREEEERQRAEVARYVQEVEREARWEEEERVQEAVRQAREEREAKVEESRRRAEDAAREAVESAERCAREDAATQVGTAEGRLKDAAAEEARAEAALETLVTEASRLRQAGAVPGGEDGLLGQRRRRKGKPTGPRAMKRRKERAANAMISSGRSGSGSGSSSDSSSNGVPSRGSSIDSGMQKRP